MAVAGLWSWLCGCPGPSSGEYSPDARSAADAPVCPPGRLDASSACGEPDPLQPVDPDAPCVLAIPKPPPDPSFVAVYLDKSLVPMSENDGWVYGPTTATLVLTGTYCDRLTASPSGSDVQLICGPFVGAPPVCIP